MHRLNNLDIFLNCYKCCAVQKKYHRRYIDLFLNSSQFMYPEILEMHLPKIWASYSTACKLLTTIIIFINAWGLYNILGKDG